MPASVSEQLSFNTLLAAEFQAFQLRLAEKSEALALEREKRLEKQISELIAENTLLCGHSVSPHVQICQKTEENNIAEDCAAITSLKDLGEMMVSERSNKEDASFAGKGPFTLLPELLKAEAIHGMVDEHAGVYWETGVLPDEPPKGCAIEPTSPMKLMWDFIGVAFLAWDILTIPLGVFDIGSLGEQILATIGYIVMLYWTIDIPIRFVTGIYNKDGELVMDTTVIRSNYLKKGFAFDVIIISGDWITVMIELVGRSAPSYLKEISILRGLRITRFARLLRLRKLREKMQTLEDSTDNEWLLVILNLFRKVVALFIINHYIGCTWFAIGNNDGIADAPYRWVTSVPYPQYDYRELGYKRVGDADWVYQYWTSVHWAIAQFTPGPNNIQPQNWVERVFAVNVLLFGICVFSTFIASVTHARMQLNKMRSKFERDNWVLRKFCRQHRISRELQMHMKRYVDLVIIPNFHKLTFKDVTLFPMLSSHLRDQLHTEIIGAHLILHPCFKSLEQRNHHIMHFICNHASENMSLARGDVAFSGGLVAHNMLFVTGGSLDYIPVRDHAADEHILPKGHWCCEAVLWTKWTHQGQLQACIESTAIQVNGVNFRSGLRENGFVMSFARRYGIRFCKALTELCSQNHAPPTDLHMQISLDIDMSSLSTMSVSMINDLQHSKLSSTEESVSEI